MEEENIEEINEGLVVVPISYTFVAINKETGKEIKDYKNVSGALISYLSDLHPELEIPSKFLRSSYYKNTGTYWYEQFYDIVKIEVIRKKKKGELYNSEIAEIVRLYNSGEVSSTHKLGEMFKVGHRKIASILNENDVIINKIGGQTLYENVQYLNRYEDTETATYRAISKKDGISFEDYQNVSGALTRYILKEYPGVEIPLLSVKMKAVLETDKYWYEEYFEIKKFNKSDLGLKKCPYCGIDIDMSVSDIKYKNHLNKEHNIDVEKHVKMYPEDLIIFKVELDRILEKLDDDNWVTCAICGRKMKFVNAIHLKSHGISAYEYRLKYGNNISKSVHDSMSIGAINTNMRGVCLSYISKPEKEIQDFLKDINIDFMPNRQILIGKEIDILVEDKKIGIEFDGCKWHSEWFGKKDKNYHLNKTLLCNEKGYGLIHIFEDEWAYNKNLVFNKLRHVFGKGEDLPRIAGRKCIIKEINKITQEKFLNLYHIQGNAASTITLGAFCGDILAGVMSFRVLEKGGLEYDLSRFATDYNYICQGVGSKMLSYFIKNYNPESIISFADRRWTLNKDDNLYIKLGFKLVAELKPDYKYYNEKVDRYKRFHKFGFRKQILHKKYGLDLSMTETEMVKSLGYDRIWDCGLLKYKLIIKK